MKHLIFSICILFSLSGYAQTPTEITRILSHYNIPRLETLRDSLKTENTNKRNYALQQAAIYGWDVKYQNADGSWSVLKEVIDDTIPLYYTTTNAGAAVATRTNHLNSGGSLQLSLDGVNMKAYVWDGGAVRTTHQELTGRVSHFDTPDGSLTVNNDHATHVTGTIAAEGIVANAKGMAPKSTIKAYDFLNDSNEVVAATLEGMLLSNHSYNVGANIFTGDWTYGAYTIESRAWDIIMYNAPYYLMVTSAGNLGNSAIINSEPMFGESGYDKLRFLQTSKNNLVVANADEPTLDSEGNFITANIYSSSSQGPTNDLRIKPDITANGKNIYSSISSTDYAYAYKTGTSMASPNVTGSLLLLQEYSRNLNDEFMRAATLKGLVMHTADDFLEDGPDPISGWGYLNTKKAAEIMRKNGTHAIIEENTLNEYETYSITVLADGINDLQVSISWTDPRGNSQYTANANTTYKRLINDLDLRVTQDTDTYFPYKLIYDSGATPPFYATQGDNTKDPFERVDIPNAQGYYTINIAHENTLYSHSQDYTLIITGIVLCTAHTDDIVITAPVTASVEPQHEHAYTTIEASNIINNGADVEYRAGYSITMTDGFYSNSGSKYHAIIGRCEGNFEPSFGARPALLEDESTIREPLTKEKALIIYPNPASETVTVELTKGFIRNITIYSLDGRMVINRNNELDNKIELPISHMEKGIYIISAQTNDGDTLTQKLIIE